VTTHATVGIVAFICGVVCAITGNVVVFKMVDRVNERLPEERQFSPLWWHLPKLLRLLTEYKRIYPDGDLARRFRVLTVLLFAFFFVTAWGLGFFSR
jgi:hypothetical protein